MLLGNRSATPGYLLLASETRQYRPLTAGGGSTAQRFHTGDRFARVTIDGQAGEWLLYRCREDDLLVHTSGEMTNPLPIEQNFQAAAPLLVSLACCVGDGLAQPLLLVELTSVDVDPDDVETRAKLLEALEDSRREQPAYSHVKPQHTLLLPPGSLPRTVKGTAQRGKVTTQFASELKAVLKREGTLPTLATKSTGAQGVIEYDSLATAESADGAPKDSYAPDSQLTHLTGLLGMCSMIVVCAHELKYRPAPNEALYGAAFIEMAVHMMSSVSMAFFLTMVGFSTQCLSQAPTGAARAALHCDQSACRRLTLACRSETAGSRLTAGSRRAPPG